jgi:hypothetical protein
MKNNKCKLYVIIKVEGFVEESLRIEHSWILTFPQQIH